MWMNSVDKSSPSLKGNVGTWVQAGPALKGGCAEDVQGFIPRVSAGI